MAPVGTITPAAQAAAYVRMSTEHQRYSVHNQMTVIRAYAEGHDLSIVRIYSDEGISGLTIEHRGGLRSLIDTVTHGRPDFSKVLVYDISRWGRFQDADQSAFYEYLCRMNGVDVVYCAEPFQNDQSPMSAVLKAVKRAMAAEYSRELGVRVFRAVSHMASRGYDTGGRIPYGLKRIIVDLSGKVVGRDRSTAQKNLRDVHVVLAPGPTHEIRVVREIFRRYVDLRETITQVATHLNCQGYRTRNGKRWGISSIAFILRNEKYIGTQTYNRSSGKLSTPQVSNSPSQWIRRPGAFKGIIDPAVFQGAQVRRDKERRGPRRSDEEILSALRKFAAKHGSISADALRKAKGMPSHGAILRHFGSMERACELIGFKGDRYLARSKERHRIRELRRGVMANVQDKVRKAGAKLKVLNPLRFTIGEKLSCALYLVKRTTVVGRWRVRFRQAGRVDYHLLGRINSDGTYTLDYYLVPEKALRLFPVRLRLRNGPSVDRYRIPNFNSLVERLVALAGLSEKGKSSVTRQVG